MRPTIERPLTKNTLRCLVRLESRPQGVQFTGQVEAGLLATWSLYKTEKRKIWHAVKVDGTESWWEEKWLTN